MPKGPLPHGRTVSHIKRTSRWNRTHRDEDESAVLEHEDRVAHVLFSTDPELLGLYGKPMARNSQIWSHDYHLLLNGPHDPRYRLDEAAHALSFGGHFGYRFLFPPMQVGKREVFWHLPLAATWSKTAPEPVRFDAGSGYLTASLPSGNHEDEVELWPGFCRVLGIDKRPATSNPSRAFADTRRPSTSGSSSMRGLCWAPR